VLKLEGNIAIVIGGTRGAEGAYIFIICRRKQELAVAVKEIGRNVIAVHGGVAPKEVEAAPCRTGGPIRRPAQLPKSRQLKRR
jgi:hypothetical protein